MIIGVLRIELELVAVGSLKDKRRILSRIKDRVRNKFNVAIAEIEGNDILNYACLGVVTVSNDQRFTNTVINKVVNLIEDIRGCMIADYTTEFLVEN